MSEIDGLNPRARYRRLASKANVTKVGYATARYWPLLKQICEPRRVRDDDGI